jgi:hypothetical protein
VFASTSQQMMETSRIFWLPNKSPHMKSRSPNITLSLLLLPTVGDVLLFILRSEVIIKMCSSETNYSESEENVRGRDMNSQFVDSLKNIKGFFNKSQLRKINKQNNNL